MLGGGNRDQGEARFLLPDSKDSASTKWMKHYLRCDGCLRADTADHDSLCAKGIPLRAAAIAEMKAIPKPPKKTPADTSFNPSIESQRR